MRFLTIIIFSLLSQVVTGQTRCYDLVKKIPCGNTEFPRQAGDFSTAIQESQFNIAQAGIVIDKQTKLQWLRCTLAKDLSYCTTPGAMTWEQAKHACTTMQLQQQKWRLPTVLELNSLIDLSRHSVKIDTRFFQDTQAAAYWTGTRSLTYKTQGSRVWFIDFAQASIFDAPIDSKHFVRCVSNGKK